MDIYVENLPPDMNDDELRRLFAGFGQVDSANIKYDVSTGKSKEFGYVEMPNPDEAHKAIESLNNFEVRGKKLAVNELRTQPDESANTIGGML
ncbi:MAG: RNA recognition motif domain-containing protein [Candidatus Latescibacterota bacterium]